MEYLNLYLFISFAAPLALAVAVCKDKARTRLAFLLIGLYICLFCGELNGFLIGATGLDLRLYTINVSPVIEEIFKMIPIMIFAFVFKPKRLDLYESAILIGVGFAILENASIFVSYAGSYSIGFALIRGFGAGMMHAFCSLMLGYGMSFVHTRRKVFYTGSIALLITAIIYHSIYNTLVQSQYLMIGYLLPIVSAIVVVLVMKKKNLL